MCLQSSESTSSSSSSASSAGSSSGGSGGGAGSAGNAAEEDIFVAPGVLSVAAAAGDVQAFDKTRYMEVSRVHFAHVFYQ
jgi:hypothetical protein